MKVSVSLVALIALLAAGCGGAPRTTSAPRTRSGGAAASVVEAAAGTSFTAGAEALDKPAICLIGPDRPPGDGRAASSSTGIAVRHAEHTAAAPPAPSAHRHPGRAAPPADPTGTAMAAPASPSHTHDGGCHPTPEEQAAAERLIADVREALLRKFDIPEKAVLAGYQRGSEADHKAHYYSWEEVKDPAVLDPAQPEGIVYRNRRVIGALFMVPTVNDTGPRIGGCLTHWHRHIRANGEPTSEALHVWIVDNPHGPFSERAPTDR